MVGQGLGWWFRVGVLLVAVSGANPGQVRAAEGGESWAKVAMRSNLETADDHIRQHAFDGQLDTYFSSKSPIRAGDYLTLIFDEPRAIKSIGATSGQTDSTDPLASMVLEVADDGTKFDRVADFDPKGVVNAELADRKVRAIRVRVSKDLPHPLIIREFTIDAPLVKPFEHPVEFTVNTTDSPDLKVWTEDAARLCEEWYDALNDELASPDFKPTNHITLTMRKSYRGVAAAGGGRITASTQYFDGHRDDQGALIHETVHIIQNYGGRRGNPGWLVEGVADYVRFYFYEPGKAGRVNPKTAKYDGSYRTTAAFLDYVSRTYDKQLVKKLNKTMREGTYDKAIFEQLTGKPVEALNEDWLASLRK